MRRISATAAATALAVALLPTLGCTTRTLKGDDPADRLFALTTDWPAFAQGPNGEPPPGAVDILFMVDDSPSMAQMQQKLAAGFASFMTAIEALPGGTPDLHIGVVSSNMGAGDGDIPGCGPTGSRGDAGRLQNRPRGTCTDSTLQAGANFISLRTDPTTGQRVTNYGGALPDVFSCIALLGDVGCGFEQPLSSVRHALDPALAPPENAGFLRPDAFLAVILVTNEDDCSARDGTQIYDISQTTLSSPLGPPGNFRCSELGHLCRVGGQLKPPSRFEAASYEGCESNEHGKLESVGDFLSFLRRLKSDPSKVFIATVAGTPAPYAINLKQPSIVGDALWPDPAHSCTASDGSFADPAVRLEQLTRMSGPRGQFANICGDTMNEPLHQIATALIGPLAPACVAPPTAGCNVVDRWVDGGIRHAAPVAACADAASAVPCWTLVEDPACATGLQLLSISRGDAAVPNGLVTAISCNGEVL